MSTTESGRRPLKLGSVDELHAELDRLQSAGYTRRGQWSLPQACRHLSVTMEGNLEPSSSDVPTPEETAMKQKFFGMVMDPQGMPLNLPIGNPALIPPEDCTDVEVDRLKRAFQTLANVPHKCIKVGRCGPVPVGELAQLHLAHAAHHLGFLIPLATDH